MSSNKKPRKTISENERNLIQRVKIELNAEGVPRNQWAEIIQERIQIYRKKTRKKKKSKFLNKIKNRIRKIALKVYSKRLLGQNSEFSDEMQENLLKMMDQFESNPEFIEKDPMSALMGNQNLNFKSIEQEGTQSIYLDKKKVNDVNKKIIDFDQNEDEINDIDEDDEDELFYE